ncbi:23S rRNA (guanosine(2251)-2'-O)-methyltransferase [hydrothermal vent metagenome]|uniref:23S rRNA (Guanosine(2251)-2'-O)-methyltransferase n=1 Tax=hydrothermal vent metagenome TaxID=652676 RepID=A0A3B0QSV8_9ZZZZ
MRIVYGINPVTEALAAGRGAISEILISTKRRDKSFDAIVKKAAARKIKVTKAEQRRLGEVAGTDGHQGVVAVFKGEYPYCDIEEILDNWRASGEAAFILILDCIQDPQNFGSLVRAAHCAGVQGIVIPKDRAAQVTPAVVKASAGATEHSLIARVTNLREAIRKLKDAGVWIAGIEASFGETIYNTELDGDIAVVIGSEGSGMRRLIREECDYQVSIPMKGQVNSMNAAQAGAVAVFEVARQKEARRQKEAGGG